MIIIWDNFLLRRLIWFNLKINFDMHENFNDLLLNIVMKAINRVLTDLADFLKKWMLTAYFISIVLTSICIILNFVLCSKLFLGKRRTSAFLYSSLN